MKSHAQHRQPDPSKGDESTVGGYAAVHDRPAAFEGSDGHSYSVELMVEETAAETGAVAEPVWGGFILYVKWSRLGAQSPEGHLESDYLVHADTEADTREQLGRISLDAVKTLLDQLIGERSGGAARPWWDAMRAEGESAES